MRKRWWWCRLFTVRDSLLWGTETSICWPVIMSQELCCLPGACIQDITEKVAEAHPSSDHYPMLLRHMGTNDSARYGPEQISSDYRALGASGEELGHRWCSCPSSWLRGRAQAGTHTLEMNVWLHRLCQWEGFGFLSHGMLFQEGQLLGKDGVYLTKNRKSIFMHQLTNLVRRDLNQVQREQVTKV